MAPVRKHIGRDKFGALFGALKTQQYVDPPTRNPSATVYVHHDYTHESQTDGAIATGRYHGMSRAD